MTRVGVSPSDGEGGGGLPTSQSTGEEDSRIEDRGQRTQGLARSAQHTVCSTQHAEKRQKRVLKKSKGGMTGKKGFFPAQLFGNK